MSQGERAPSAFLYAAAAALALCGCTSPRAGGAGDAWPRDCFRTLDIDSYGVLDDRRVQVVVNPRRNYILTIRDETSRLDWATVIAVRAPVSFVCVGDGLGVELMGGDPPRRYPVISVERASAQSQHDAAPNR